MVDTSYLDAIKQFEGYAGEARWDYAQNTNGYGTKARYAGEVIDKAEAERRFSSEIQKAADIVDKFAPGLDDGSKAALTSLTYNAGTAWMQSGLGQAIASGDLDKAKSLFLQYNKAGGATLDGLVQRRLQEVAWFGQGVPATQGVSAGFAAMASAASASAVSQSSPITSPSMRTAYRPATIASHMSADSSPQNFPTLGSDQMLLSLLSKMAQQNGADNRSSDDKKSNRDSNESSRMPQASPRVG
ncbi:lysozyme [Hyphomicrobium sp.]|uniref:lysozyme n=1 Tax=Hyphomicrobium sp. TaxID=82 RepID=UPI000FBDDBE5|nr:lysozyme [Hyphomicrobium sp.]RUO98698.1 MAG: glycoside hydrolase family 24 [Hyphomicrobium sp.]